MCRSRNVGSWRVISTWQSGKWRSGSRTGEWRTRKIRNDRRPSNRTTITPLPTTRTITGHITTARITYTRSTTWWITTWPPTALSSTTSDLWHFPGLCSATTRRRPRTVRKGEEHRPRNERLFFAVPKSYLGNIHRYVNGLDSWETWLFFFRIRACANFLVRSTRYREIFYYCTYYCTWW